MLNAETPSPDRRLAWTVLAVFLCSSWPIALVSRLPYQDLPNHLASMTVVMNASEYPEYVVNGFFKTNALFFFWLNVVGRAVGLDLAARLFALVTLGLGSFVLPWFVVRVRSVNVLRPAIPFLPPLVHLWFVSMGMLDYAAGFFLSIALLGLLEKQSGKPTGRRTAAIALLALLTWFAHAFALLVALLLWFIDVLPRRNQWARAARYEVLGLVPAALLCVRSIALKSNDGGGAMAGFVERHKTMAWWEYAYNLWAEGTFGFTRLSAGTLILSVVLLGYALTSLRAKVRFFSWPAGLLLLLLYLLVPGTIRNWFHVNSRFIPFLWVFALVRVPESIHKWVRGALLTCTASVSLAMGVDYVRLSRDEDEVLMAMPDVPKGAHLLPLMFREKKTSENTRSLLHAWGDYVVEKHVHVPLLFASSKDFPITYREAPPPLLSHVALEMWVREHSSEADFCAHRTASSCHSEFVLVWDDFWKVVAPTYDYVLLYGSTPEVRALLPAQYEFIFTRGDLALLRAKR